MTLAKKRRPNRSRSTTRQRPPQQSGRSNRPGANTATRKSGKVNTQTNGALRNRLVIGDISGLTVVCGALGLIIALCVAITLAFPLVTAEGEDLGRASGIADVIAIAPLLIGLGWASVLCVRKKLPRLGLAILAPFGALSIGELFRLLRLYEPGSSASTDLPLPKAVNTAFSYQPSAGLMLSVITAVLGVMLLLLIPTAWGRTVMEDDNPLEALRSKFAGWSFFAGLIGITAIGIAPSHANIAGAGPTTLPGRSGLLMAGDLLFIAALLICAVIAPTLRPRLAVVGMYLGLAIVLATRALQNGVLIARTDVLHASTGTVLLYLSAGVFALLSIAAWQVRKTAEIAG